MQNNGPARRGDIVLQMNAEQWARAPRMIKTSLESNGIVYSTTESHSPLGIRVHVGSSTYSCTAPFYDSDKYEIARLTFSESHKIEIKNIGYFRIAEDLCVTLCTTIMRGVQ